MQAMMAYSLRLKAYSYLVSKSNILSRRGIIIVVTIIVMTKQVVRTVINHGSEENYQDKKQYEVSSADHNVKLRHLTAPTLVSLH